MPHRTLLAPQIPLAALFSVAVACSGDPAAATGFTSAPPLTTTPQSTSDAGGASTHASTSTSGESSTAGASDTSTAGLSDLGQVPDFGPQHPVGCRGKIDFLFVISTSGTMKGFQDQLAASFPGFLASIQEHFDDFDIHILSANPNGYWDMDDCADCADEECDPNASPPTCGVTLTACDKTIGAGVAFPAGTGSANRRCDFFGGQRYIVGEDPNFEDSYACMIQAGMNGAYPHTSESMVKAISPEYNGPGGCNEGFLRDDALLVVTLLDDGYDDFSQGTPISWSKALWKAKHFDHDALAVLVLTTDVDAGPNHLCWPDEDFWMPSKNPLRLLVENVRHGFIGSICEETYTPFFEETVAEVVALCDGFIIPQ